ncbi:hypothetical protein CRYUN_Cryun35bG0050100 [Craigia yunnanensis]
MESFSVIKQKKKVIGFFFRESLITLSIPSPIKGFFFLLFHLHQSHSISSCTNFVFFTKLLYADPMKYYSEFKMILEQNNGSCYELLDKALEQDCSRRKSIKRKGEGSKSTANKGAGASKGKKKLNQNQAKGDQVHDSNLRKSSSTAQRKRGKTSEQGEEQKKVKPNSPNSDSIKSGTPKQNKLLKEKSNSQTSERTSPGNSPKLSTRRMRVMQGLGLVAPPGSPFHKNGLI